MKNKRICNFILILCLIVQCFAGVAYSSEGTASVDIFDNYTDNQKTAFEFLKALGIASDLDETEQAVSRAQFTDLLLKVMKIEALTAGTDVRFFYDVRRDHPYYNQVMTAVTYGIANGYSEHIFLPDAEIDTIEAVRMLLNAMGYGQLILASGSGDDDSMIFTIASRAGIDRSVLNYTKPLKVIQIYEILFEGLCGAIFYQTAVGDPNLYEIDENRTILSEYYNIFLTEGMVNSNSITALRGYFANDGKVNIAGEFYEIDDEGYNDYLGYEVNAFYEEKDGIKRIVYMKPANSVRELIIDCDDIGHFSDNILRYYKEDRISNARLDPAYTVIFNGVYLESYDQTIFRQVEGNVKLISADGDSVYELAKIESYVDCRISRVDTSGDDLIFVMARSEQRSIEIDTASTKLEVIKNGERVSADELALLLPNTVISISASKFTEVNGVKTPDKTSEFMQIVICEDVVEGFIAEERKTEGGAWIYTVDGMEYTLSSVNCLGSKKISTEKSGMLYLDFSGEIADFAEGGDDASRNYRFGYLIAARLGGGIDPNCIFKLLTADGEVKIYEADDNFQLNNKSVSDREILPQLAQSAKYARPEAEDVSQLVKYRLASDDAVKGMQTLVSAEVGYRYEGDEEHIRLDLPRENLQTKWQTGNCFFGDIWSGDMGIVKMGRPQVIFQVPTSQGKDEDYTIISEVSSDGSYNIEGYNMNNALIPETAVIYTDDATISHGTYMVDGVYKKLNDNGDIINYLKVSNGSTAYEYEIGRMEPFSALKRGDLIILYGSRKGIASGYNLLVSVDNLPDVGVSHKVAMDGSRSDFSEVYYIENRNLVLQNGSIIDTNTGKRDTQWGFYMSDNASILRECILYDETGDREPTIRKAELNDIKPAYLFGEQASKVYTVISYGEGRTLVVYNMK